MSEEYDFHWDETDPEWDDSDIISFIRGLKEAVISFKGFIKCG